MSGNLRMRLYRFHPAASAMAHKVFLRPSVHAIHTYIENVITRIVSDLHANIRSCVRTYVSYYTPLTVSIHSRRSSNSKSFRKEYLELEFVARGIDWPTAWILTSFSLLDQLIKLGRRRGNLFESDPRKRRRIAWTKFGQMDFVLIE